MAENLRLRVILDMVEKVVAPLKRVSAGSSEAARSLKAARDRLKELNEQQGAVSNMQRQQAEFARLNNELKIKQSLLAGLKASGSATAAQIGREEKSVASLASALAKQRERAGQARVELNKLGVTGSLSGAQARLKSDIDQTTASIQSQRHQLQQLAEQHRRVQELNTQHSKAMMHTGMVGAAGAGALVAGNKIAAPVRAAIGAFMPAEIAENQLQASVMAPDGSLSKQYAEVVDLATRLGDKLPGTTADFIEMMTMLRRQGISEKAILGGLGEASAYLGVQMRMPVTAAAEFGAKMQDATQTAEEDMMSLMDVIQRAYYLGVDPTNMLQGFTKMSAAMPYLGTKGLEASKMLAPLLVMMDQTGMAGESAGNAIRKVVQLSLDRKKVDKANAILADDGVSLKFSNKDGNFAGLDNLFAQLERLKSVKSAETRIAALKKLFGDDAETHQVLETLMAKGLDGYREVVAKMQAQADLRRRVDASLKTVTASAESAQGSFSNMLKDAGATIAPDLVKILNALGDAAAGSGAWIRENKETVKWVMRLVAVMAVLVTAAGTLAIAYASIAGPLLLLRFLVARVGLSLFGMRAAATAGAGGVGILARAGGWLLASWSALRAMGMAGVMLRIGTAFQVAGGGVGIMRVAVMGVWRLLTWFVRANPVAAVILGVGTAFANLALRWDELKAYFDAGEWSKLGAAIWEGIEAGLNAATLGAYGIVKTMIGSMWKAAKSAVGVDGSDSDDEEVVERRTIRKTAATVATAATMAMPMAANAAALQIDTRPPLSLQAMGHAGHGGGNSYTITINAAPGMDEKALARLVTAELDRRDRNKRAAVNSSMSDVG